MVQPPDGTTAPESASAEAAIAPLTPAAARALAEARERRAAAERAPAGPRELNGRGGLEPVRYGDWEVKGLTSDF